MKNFFASKQLGTIAVASSLALLLAACGQEDKQQQERPKMTVSTIKAHTQGTEVTAELPGRVNALKDAQVLARVSGNIESINFEQGSRVKKGDMLFKIDPKPYQAAVDEAQAKLSQMRASAQSANALSKRYGNLVDSAAISRQEYDNARADAGKANADIKAAQAALKKAQIDLGYTRVESPIAGVVGKAIVTEGALVSNNPPTELAVVQQLDEVYVDFNQSASDLAKVRFALERGELSTIDGENLAVEVVTSDGYEYPEKGKLLFTGVAVDPATGQVQLRSLFPNENHILLPGMYVTVRIPVGYMENAILVPKQALQLTSTGRYEVSFVVDGKVKKKTVKVGSEVGPNAIILSGIKEGDEIIVEGFDKVSLNQPVKPQPWSKSKDGAAGNQASPAKDAEAQDSEKATEENSDSTKADGEQTSEDQSTNVDSK